MTSSPPSAAGKVVIITGASSGIGFEASAKIAAMGSRVVMVARDVRRGEAAREAIRKRSGSDAVDLLKCDVSSMAQVRALADQFRERYDRLDVLVNNAGSVKRRRETTVDGFEWTFAANYLGHFLLTNLLLDRLRASAPSRIVNVSSEAHRRATLDFENLHYEKDGYSIPSAYGRSKLAQVVFTVELARRLSGSAVTVNALHPGAVATNIWNAARFPWYIRYPIAVARRVIMITPADAADRVVYLATSPEVEGRTGGYYEKNKEVPPSLASHDPARGKRLWEESEKLVERSSR